MNEVGRVAWRSPSNIAIVKYWGKKPVQIPANPSISVTLEEAFTETILGYSPRKTAWGDIDLEFWFEGKPNEVFRDKILRFLTGLLPVYPSLGKFHLEIQSRNTFPHSAGIASSASGMSALCLCLIDFLNRTGQAKVGDRTMMREASALSRLASGSACRSVFGGFTVWGYHPEIQGSSDNYAIPLPTRIHSSFQDLRDVILVVSAAEKPVSSRIGHSLMDHHHFASQRYKMANENITALVNALSAGDWESFISITELEALTLHGLMMSSSPSFLLFEPNTINIVNAIRNFRNDTLTPVCFTLDAGPNVHMIFPGSEESKIRDWINSEILQYCYNRQWINDKIGNGPERL